MALTLSTFKATRGNLQAYGDASAVLKVMVLDDTVIDNEDELVAKITDIDASEVTGGTYVATTLAGVDWDVTGDIPGLIADDVLVEGLNVPGPSPLVRYYVVYVDDHDVAGYIGDLVSVLEQTSAAVVGDVPIQWPGGYIATVEEGEATGGGTTYTFNAPLVEAGGEVDFTPTGVPSGAKYLRDDNTWAVPTGSGTGTVVTIVAGTNITVDDTDPENPIVAATGGTGDVVGPASATNNSLARFDGTTGLLLKNGAVIGSDVQAYDADLAALAGVTSAADKVPYFTGSGTASTFTATSAARTVLDDTTTAAMLATLGAVPTATFPVCEVIAISDETTAITTGTAKVTWRAPWAFTLTAVRASLNTVSSSGDPTFDINEGGTTVLSTKLTIDSGEKTSVTASAPAVISDPNIADDAEITFDIDSAGTGAKGAKIVLYGTRVV